jgi:hypothetical protein
VFISRCCSSSLPGLVQVVRLLFLSGVLGFCWLGRSPGGVALGNAMSPAALFCRHECSL